MLRYSTDRGGTYKQSIPAARRTDIIKPGYPGLEAVKPVNPGLKNTPLVCIPYRSPHFSARSACAHMLWTCATFYLFIVTTIVPN